MMKYGRWGTGIYPMKRERPLKENKVNLRFFPEGGNLIQGIASRVAFEATDEAGNPIDVNGAVIDGNKQELCAITTEHEGRGVFTYTPTSAAGRQKDFAEVEYSGKRYRFDLPEGLTLGVVMEVDNLTHPDSIGINLRKNGNTPAEMLGMAVISGGKMQHYRFVWMEDEEISFTMNKTQFPAGVSQIVLFNSNGEILCDRLVFINTNEFLKINVETGRAPSLPKPHELVNMEFTVADMDINPVQVTFSLSVRDAANEVESKQNILTDLLLMSEIKGYVRNPSYYFDVETGHAPSKNEIVETGRAPSKNGIEKTGRAPSLHLDHLLMVQGWRRYSWQQMSDVETWHAASLPIKYHPEQGIETHGQVVNPLLKKQTPKPNVDVDMVLHQKREGGETDGSFVETFVTDQQGRFSFSSDVSGRWNMILSAKEKGKPKNYMILLDRIFSPEPKRYRYADMQISIAEKYTELVNVNETHDEPVDDSNLLFAAFQDSIAKLGITEKVNIIPEVTVKAKRNSKEQEIFYNRSTSVAYYDVTSEMDDIYDKGKYIGNNIHEILLNMNMSEQFNIRRYRLCDEVETCVDYEFLFYKRRMMLFVVDYEKTLWNPLGYFKYKDISLSSIKSIYINENVDVMAQYIQPDVRSRVSPMQIAMDLGCAVFIETYPEGQISVEGAKGVRKTWLEGYSPVKEFYSPNYSELPPAPDYRRTLYWNPMVTPDETGKAKINFYNNSSCTNFSISAETVSAIGAIGVFKQ